MIDVKKKVRERTSTASRKPVAHAVGRRKTSVARVWLRSGSGAVVVNDLPLEKYFDTLSMREAAMKTSSVVPQVARYYDVDINVAGGGKNAQADAIKLGLARAFFKMHDDIRGVLKEYDLFKRDSRKKERKKPGQKAARRKFQFVKR
jgi:small subunit ribosomal protein S9